MNVIPFLLLFIYIISSSPKTTTIKINDSSITDATFENSNYPSFECLLKVLKIRFDENIDPSQSGIMVYKTRISIHIIKSSHINVFPIKYNIEFTWNIDEKAIPEENDEFTLEKNRKITSILENPLLKVKNCLEPEISQESENRKNYKIKIPYDSVIYLTKYYKKEGYGDVYSINTIFPESKLKVGVNFIIDSQCQSLNKIKEMLIKICNEED